MRFFCLFFLTERMMLVSVVHNRPDRTTCVCISKPLCTATSSLWPSSKTHFSPTEEKKEKKKNWTLFLTVQSVTLCLAKCAVLLLYFTHHVTPEGQSIDCRSNGVCGATRHILHTFFYTKGEKKKRKWGNFLKESGLKESFGLL